MEAEELACLEAELVCLEALVPVCLAAEELVCLEALVPVLADAPCCLEVVVLEALCLLEVLPPDLCACPNTSAGLMDSIATTDRMKSLFFIVLS